MAQAKTPHQPYAVALHDGCDKTSEASTMTLTIVSHTGHVNAGVSIHKTIPLIKEGR
jgi:hypothetical protein